MKPVLIGYREVSAARVSQQPDEVAPAVLPPLPPPAGRGHRLDRSPPALTSEVSSMFYPYSVTVPGSAQMEHDTSGSGSGPLHEDDHQTCPRGHPGLHPAEVC